MADVYYSNKLRSWHLCFTFRNFHDAKVIHKRYGQIPQEILNRTEILEIR